MNPFKFIQVVVRGVEVVRRPVEVRVWSHGQGPSRSPKTTEVHVSGEGSLLTGTETPTPKVGHERSVQDPQDDTTQRTRLEKMRKVPDQVPARGRGQKKQWGNHHPQWYQSHPGTLSPTPSRGNPTPDTIPLTPETPLPTCITLTLLLPPPGSLKTGTPYPSLPPSRSTHTRRARRDGRDVSTTGGTTMSYSPTSRMSEAPRSNRRPRTHTRRGSRVRRGSRKIGSVSIPTPSPLGRSKSGLSSHWSPKFQ